MSVGTTFSDGTYIGPGNSFDISVNDVLVISGKQDPNGEYLGASIVTKNRISQQLNPNLSWNAVNGYYGLAKDAYPAVSEAYAEKAVSEWNLISTTPNIWWSSICWSSELGIFCSIGYNGNNVIVSNDGIIWDTSSTPIKSYHTVWSKELGIFCAVGNEGNRVQTSIDGYNWIEIPTIDPSAQLIEWYQIAWSPELGLFCAVGTGTAGLKRIMTSSDGINWQLQNSPTNNEVFVSITWSPELGMFCAGENSSRIFYSFDGIIWVQGNGTIPGTWRNITWSPKLGKFCAVSFSPSNIATSNDGINWILSDKPSTMQWWGLTWSNELNIFVATASVSSGTNSKITYSYDGLKWYLVPNSNYNRNMRSIAWSPELGIFCANGTGQGGVIISSLAGRPPTSYNVFNSSFNNIDQLGNWTIKTKKLVTDTSLTINSALNVRNNISASSFISPHQFNSFPENSLNLDIIHNSTSTDWYYGGVLGPNGKIYTIPFTHSRVMIIDPIDNIVSFIQAVEGPYKWIGGVVARNGKIYGIPYASNNVLMIDTTVNTVSYINNVGNNWAGGVLAPNGKIYGIPAQATNVLIIDPSNDTVNTTDISNLSAGTQTKWFGGVLSLDGRIFCIPHDSSNVLVIDPVTNNTTYISVPDGTGKWNGGALAPNGKIYGIPYNSNNVLIIDPLTNTADTTTISVPAGGLKWYGGVLAPNGKIYGIPYDRNDVLIINPETNTTELISGNISGTWKWTGGVLAPNGTIYAIPRRHQSVLQIKTGLPKISLDFALSAHFNKM